MRDRRVLALVDQMCSADTTQLPFLDRRRSILLVVKMSPLHCTADGGVAALRQRVGPLADRASTLTLDGEGARSDSENWRGDAAAPAGDDDDAAAPVVAAAESAAAAAACGVDGCAGVRADEPGSRPPRRRRRAESLSGRRRAVRGGGGRARGGGRSDRRSIRGCVRLNQRVGQRAGREELRKHRGRSTAGSRRRRRRPRRRPRLVHADRWLHPAATP